MVPPFPHALAGPGTAPALTPPGTVFAEAYEAEAAWRLDPQGMVSLGQFGDKGGRNWRGDFRPPVASHRGMTPQNDILQKKVD